MSLSYESDAQDEPGHPDDSYRPAPPFPIYTVILMAAYGVVTAAQMAAGLDNSILRAGFVKQAFRDGEYWRILTGAALHAGLIHLAFNSYAFYSFGKIMEMLTARAHLAIVFLLAAVGGGGLSYLLSPNGISVGASGGIVGLIGYLAIYAFKRKDLITPEFRRGLLMNIGFILLYGLVMWQTIDNFGHIGGLLTGALYGLIQVPGNLYADPRQVSGPTRVAGVMAMAVYIATCGFAVLKVLSIL